MVTKNRTAAQVQADEAEVKSAANPLTTDKGGNVVSAKTGEPAIEAQKPDVEVSAEDKLFVRKTFLDLHKQEVNLRKATVAIGEVLWKLLDRAVEHSLTDNGKGEKLPNLGLAEAYVVTWAKLGEDEWQKRDLLERIESGEVDKGSSDLRPIGTISGTYQTYKSYFLKGLRAGINPHEPMALLEGEDQPMPRYSTANDYMKAAREKDKASRAPRTPTAKGGVLLKIVTGSDDLNKPSPNMEAVLSNIIKAVRSVPTDKQDEAFENYLKVCLVTMNGIVAQYKQTETAANGETRMPTGAVAQATTGDPAADKAAADVIATENAETPAAVRPARKR